MLCNIVMKYTVFQINIKLADKPLKNQLAMFASCGLQVTRGGLCFLYAQPIPRNNIIFIL